MSSTPRETPLIDRARALTEQGLRLLSLDNLAELNRWDQDVNEFLQQVDLELAEGLSSLTLKRRLDGLMQLYTAVICHITELKGQNDREEASLLQKRRALYQ